MNAEWRYIKRGSLGLVDDRGRIIGKVMDSLVDGFAAFSEEEHIGFFIDEESAKRAVEVDANS